MGNSFPRLVRCLRLASEPGCGASAPLITWLNSTEGLFFLTHQWEIPVVLPRFVFFKESLGKNFGIPGAWAALPCQAFDSCMTSWSSDLQFSHVSGASSYPALMGLLGKCVPSVLFFSSNTSAFPGSLALAMLRSCCGNRFRGGILVTGDWGRMERCVLLIAVVFGCSFLCYCQNRNRISNNGNDSTWCPTWFGGFNHVYSHNLGCCLLWLDWVGNYLAVGRFVVFGLIRTHPNRFFWTPKSTAHVCFTCGHLGKFVDRSWQIYPYEPWLVIVNHATYCYDF